MSNICYVCHVCGFESAFNSKELAVAEFKKKYIEMIQKHYSIVSTDEYEMNRILNELNKICNDFIFDKDFVTMKYGLENFGDSFLVTIHKKYESVAPIGRTRTKLADFHYGEEYGEMPDYANGTFIAPNPENKHTVIVMERNGNLILKCKDEWLYKV